MNTKSILWIAATVALLASEVTGRAEQGIVTITHEAASATNRSRLVSIGEGQAATVKSVWDDGSTQLVVNFGGTNFMWPILDQRTGRFTPLGMVFAGPATIQLFRPNQIGSSSFATLEIQPASFPPDKALTVGSNAGNVRVTMESSTDLVNWTPAVNGAVYTNSPDARFFRIKVDK